jgi:hypothetical protein
MRRVIFAGMSLEPNETSGPRSKLVFEHTDLGSFVAEGDIWTATIAEGDRKVEVSLAGNEAGPHEALLTAASALLERMAEVKEQALGFLTSQEEAPDREDFICQGVEFLREDYPNHFSLSFVLFGDDGGVWRVEFEDGEPLFLARDD